MAASSLSTNVRRVVVRQQEQGAADYYPTATPGPLGSLGIAYTLVGR